jgi:opacity protein-like surface antigen
MNRRLWTCLAAIAILSSSAAGAGFGADLDHPYRDHPRDYRSRDRSFRGGFEGRTMLRVHAGISGATGDFDDAVNTGWGLGASVGYGVSRNVVLSGGVAYHRFGEQFVNGHVSIVPVTMSVDYGFASSGQVRPWISGGLGLYHVGEEVAVSPFATTSDSEDDFGVNFGFGIAMPLSPRTAFGAGFKFHHIDGNNFPDTDFLALQAGLAFPL